MINPQVVASSKVRPYVSRVMLAGRAKVGHICHARAEMPIPVGHSEPKKVGQFG
jgi:hypothetical protein